MEAIRAALLFAFAASLIAQDPPAGGTVEGVVINSVTGAGIGGASVTLSGNQSNKYPATTDIAGHFKITGIAPGSYRTNVEKDGFAPPALDLASFLNGPGLRINAGNDPVKLEFKLAPFGTIRGRVLGPDGKPLKGVEVKLNPNNMANEVLTDEEGRFALESTRPDSYTLSAKPPEVKAATRTGMVTTYYPSAADQFLAQKIEFGGQSDFGGFEIRMQTAEVYRVRGIVLDEKGKPSPGAELALVRNPERTPGPIGLGSRPGLALFAVGIQRAPNGAPEATAIAGEDGRFEFPAVRSGDWRINVVSDGGTASRGWTNALVTRSDVEDLQIHAATPFKLTGAVEWKGEAPSQRDPFFGGITLLNPENNELTGSGIVENGTLLFENMLPGSYKAIVQPGLSAQIFLGDYEITGQTFPVSADGPRLRVFLKKWAGTVRGTVEKGEGAMAVLFPQRSDGVTFGQTVVCGPGGSFEMSEVSPGDYYIAAFDKVNVLSPSAAMLNLVPSRGTSVKVEERSAASVTLSVIATPR